jgi:hypothetical protein
MQSSFEVLHPVCKTDICKSFHTVAKCKSTCRSQKATFLVHRLLVPHICQYCNFIVFYVIFVNTSWWRTPSKHTQFVGQNISVLCTVRMFVTVDLQTFHAYGVCKFMIYLHTKFHTTESLVSITRRKAVAKIKYKLRNRGNI